MEGLYPLKLSQLCIPIIFILVVYIPNTLSKEIGVNCGSGAVVGQPYNMECTNIPETLNNGINVFFGDKVNSIITCTPTKNCFLQDRSKYSVRSPHNELVFFTILNVTTDDIGKKLYCVDDSTLDSTSQPSCTLALVQNTAVPETSTTRITDEQTNPEATTTSMGGKDDDGGNGLPGGAIAGIVIAVIVVCGVVIIIIVCICKKKESKSVSRSL